MPTPIPPVEYDVDDVAVLQVLFEDAAAAAADPDDTTLIYRDPNGVEVEKTGTVSVPDELENPAVGTWIFRLRVTNVPGVWVYRFKGVSADLEDVNAAGERRFLVRATSITAP